MKSAKTEKKGTILMHKYEIGKLLGQGTFAKVYHARNLKTGQYVAVKVIDKEKVLKVGLIDQIKREIRGGELFNKVAKGRLRESAAGKYFQQLIASTYVAPELVIFHSMTQKDGTVKMQGSKEGRKGQLAIDAEIFEITPAFHVAQVTKKSGDTAEYRNFCDQGLKPSLKDIVWTWQGNEQQQAENQEIKT
ncbi:CBL-interacting serine/threonine-protein kinase 20-like [Solanum tuberosum]|nr:PREDICTED: CBL-interacting serine/threonine-protein kinase 20-like [Solanum tuberosum]